MNSFLNELCAWLDRDRLCKKVLLCRSMETGNQLLRMAAAHGTPAVNTQAASVQGYMIQLAEPVLMANQLQRIDHITASIALQKIMGTVGDAFTTLGKVELTTAESVLPQLNELERNLVTPEQLEEAEILKAEKVRLKYVALTRAEDEAHVFTLRIESGEGKAKTHKIWSGFEATGAEAAPINVEDVEEQVAPSDELERTARAEQHSLECRLPMITQAAVKRVTPSEVDATRLKQEPVKVEEQIGQGQIATVQTRPGGTSWGTAVHRAAELIVSGGHFTAEALEAAATQAVMEAFDSELMSDRDRASLLLPKDAKTLEQIRKYLAGEIIDSMRFMLDENSGFRKMLKGAVCYPEMPFVISIGTEEKVLFEKLAPLTKVGSESRIDISGKIDLALRYPDGTWRIVDYKTDRMLPCDHDDVQAFRQRLDREYGNQLSTYQAVLEYLTGEKVVEAKLLAI